MTGISPKKGFFLYDGRKIGEVTEVTYYNPETDSTSSSVWIPWGRVKSKPKQHLTAEELRAKVYGIADSKEFNEYVSNPENYKKHFYFGNPTVEFIYHDGLDEIVSYNPDSCCSQPMEEIVDGRD
jgi:hypothetical protein